MIHVLLDLFGVVCDPNVMTREYRLVMASLLDRWYGGGVKRWLRAHDIAFEWYRRHWPTLPRVQGKYLQFWRQPEIKYMRKVFKEAKKPLSLTDDEVFELSRRRTYEITSRIDAAYPDAKKYVKELHCMV